MVRMARQMTLLADDAEEALRSDAGSAGDVALPIVINGDSLNTWALHALSRVDSESRIRFEVHRADEAQSTALLRDGTVMAAVTSVAQPVQGCTTRRIGTMRYRPMASPDFRNRWFPDGPLVDALAQAPVVCFDRDDQLQDRYLRRRTRRKLRPPRHYIPVSADFATAISLGLGWGMLPPQQSGPYVARGDLVELDPDNTVDVALYWQQWKLHSPMLARLADTVAETAAAWLS